MTIYEIQNNILEIVDNQENFSRGDLQAAIEAQVMIAYNLGKESEEEPYIKDYILEALK